VRETFANFFTDDLRSGARLNRGEALGVGVQWFDPRRL
jgi:hypothetical protein